MNELQGRTCLITGASRGLGAALTRAFHAAGADLLLLARNGADLQQAIDALPQRDGQRVTAIVEDLAEPGAPARIYNAVKQAGGLDVLVNNAAIQGPIGELWENDFDRWQETLTINFVAPVALCRLLIPMLMERGGGQIINLSGGGATAPRPNFSAYASSKAALVHFSETLADEVRAAGIGVNCVAPGAMPTAMLEAVERAGKTRAGERELQAVARARTAGSATLDRAVALTLFLAAQRGSDITGKLISAVWDPWENLREHLDDIATSDIYTLRRITPKDRQLSWGDR